MNKGVIKMIEGKQRMEAIPLSNKEFESYVMWLTDDPQKRKTVRKAGACYFRGALIINYENLKKLIRYV